MNHLHSLVLLYRPLAPLCSREDKHFYSRHLQCSAHTKIILTCKQHHRKTWALIAPWWNKPRDWQHFLFPVLFKFHVTSESKTSVFAYKLPSSMQTTGDSSSLLVIKAMMRFLVHQHLCNLQQPLVNQLPRGCRPVSRPDDWSLADHLYLSSLIKLTLVPLCVW